MVLSTAEILTKPALTNFSSTTVADNVSEAKKTLMAMHKNGMVVSFLLIFDYNDRSDAELDDFQKVYSD